MGPSKMSGHKANHWSLTHLLLTAFFISGTLDSTFLFFTLITYRVFFTTSSLFAFSLWNIFFTTLSKMLKVTFSAFTTLVKASIVPPLLYWNAFLFWLPFLSFCPLWWFLKKQEWCHFSIRCSWCSVLSFIRTFPSSQRSQILPKQARLSGLTLAFTDLTSTALHWLSSISIHRIYQVCSPRVSTLFISPLR